MPSSDQAAFDCLCPQVLFGPNWRHPAQMCRGCYLYHLRRFKWQLELLDAVVRAQQRRIRELCERWKLEGHIEEQLEQIVVDMALVLIRHRETLRFMEPLEARYNRYYNEVEMYWGQLTSDEETLLFTQPPSPTPAQVRWAEITNRMLESETGQQGAFVDVDEILEVLAAHEEEETEDQQS